MSPLWGSLLAAIARPQGGGKKAKKTDSKEAVCAQQCTGVTAAENSKKPE